MNNRYFFWGLGLIAGCVLMLEIALTRVFSVIMFHHMSLVSVSMAMFGLTIGSLAVHWFPKFFSLERIAPACGYLALFFGLSIIFCLVTSLNIPFLFGNSLIGILIIILWNIIIAFPFIFGGICICALLICTPREIGRLYASDLAGASLGCLIIVWLLNRIDALSSIFIVASLAIFASFIFFQSSRKLKRGLFSLLFAIIVLIFALANSKIHWVKVKNVLGKEISYIPKYEIWNAFSFITVSSPIGGRFYWGKGSKGPAKPTATDSFISIDIDFGAATPLVNFNGNWEEVNWLMYDVTSLAYHLRTTGPVLVIGSGGGRDVLASLITSRGKRTVVGIDINPSIIDIVTNKEAEFAGYIDDLPNVTFYVDEARSWVARSKNKFQIISIPLVDTLAASTAGAFALTENSIYTVEAFELFLEHLSEDGILSISRWWKNGQTGEPHRLAGLAAAALRQKGIENPRQHILISKGNDLLTVLVAKNPFSMKDLENFRAVNQKCGFLPLMTPLESNHSLLKAAIELPYWYGIKQLSNVNLEPPTKDWPYFFQIYKISNLFKEKKKGKIIFNLRLDKQGATILFALEILVTVLALCMVFLPFCWEHYKKRSAYSHHLLLTTSFFACIGFGFMLFESAQMQRLNIFLGYPIYALTVVLFSLLLSSSFGSHVAQKIFNLKGIRVIPKIGLSLIGVLIILGTSTPFIINHFEPFSNSVRLLVSVILIIPAGIFMGMFFPIGLRLCAKNQELSLAWCWAINGISSTCAAIYSIGISISFGFSSTYWVGTLFYGLASLILLKMAHLFSSDNKF